MADVPVSGPTEVFLEILDAQGEQYDGRFLRVDSVSSNISRSAVVIPLPQARKNGASGPERHMPQAYALDFGLASEFVQVQGKCLDSDLDVRIATYSWLRQAALGGWADTRPASSGGSFQTVGGLRLQVHVGEGQTRALPLDPVDDVVLFSPSVQWYAGTCTAARFSRAGGGTSWDFALTLAVTSWPHTTQPMGRVGPGNPRRN